MTANRAAEELDLFDTGPVVTEGKGRIRPRARILRTIGADLISSEVVAVIELVRNCYDADATIVRLIFDHPEDPEEARLQIRDDGHGMTKETLLGPWLEPATDHKGTPGSSGAGGERSPGGRRRLGSKGVGRFASQRLGDHLTVRTRATRSQTELSAWFDWAELEKGRYLDELQIPWKESHPSHIESGHGTHLVITELRDRWTPDRFEKLRLGLARLISPTLREHFRIQIEVNGAKELIMPVLDLDEAMYSIEGDVDEHGHCVIRYSDLSGAEETWERTVIWPQDNTVNCGPLAFRIGAWDLDSVPLRHFLKQSGKKVGLREFRRAIRDHSGVSLYRDEFRILPYGEPDNDWLRLDRRRVNNPTMRLSNNQILGSIHLTADDNPELRDQTNREGLVANEAYNHLQEVALELLGYLETRRFAARRSLDLDWQRRTSSLPALDPDGNGDLSRILDSLSADGGTPAGAADEVRKAFKDLRESSAAVVRHYAGLASSGQLSGVVFRQLRHPIRQIRSDLDLALNDLKDGPPDSETLEDICQSLSTAIQHLGSMTKRMDALDPLASAGRSRRVSEVMLAEVVVPVIDAFADEFDRAAVRMDFLKGKDERVRTNPEVAQQVLANLLDNAVHWAPRGDCGTPAISLRLTSSGFLLWDTGPGIAKKHKRMVFEPHFTTREDAHGLGLTLVKDLLKTIGGRIRLKDPGNAKFEVVLDSREK